MTTKEIANIQGADRLDAQLSELRTALRELRSPGLEEDVLRGVFRSRRAAADSVRESAQPRWRRAPVLATAAVFVVGVGTGALLGLDRFGGDAADQAQVRPASSSDAAPAGAFQPLMYAPGFSPTGSYSVVRVRIPLSSLAIGQGGELDGVIEADLLLGEDGLASGIRFDAEDTLLVSTVSR